MNTLTPTVAYTSPRITELHIETAEALYKQVCAKKLRAEADKVIAKQRLETIGTGEEAEKVRTELEADIELAEKEIRDFDIELSAYSLLVLSAHQNGEQE